MKRALTFPLLLATSIVAYTQDMMIIDAKKISENETPDEVMKSLSQDFPDAQSAAYYVLTDENLESDWLITEQSDFAPDEEVDYYTVTLKGKKGGYINALYNAEGDLQMMKMQANDFILPKKVRDTIVEKYKGYSIKSDKYVKVVHRKSSKEHMEVVVSKDGKNKKLYFDKNGDFVKEKSS